MWLNIFCELLILMQDETNLSTKGNLKEQGILGLPGSFPNAQKVKWELPTTVHGSPVEWLEREVYSIMEEAVNCILTYTFQVISFFFFLHFIYFLARNWMKHLEVLAKQQNFPKD